MNQKITFLAILLGLLAAAPCASFAQQKEKDPLIAIKWHYECGGLPSPRLVNGAVGGMAVGAAGSFALLHTMMNRMNVPRLSPARLMVIMPGVYLASLGGGVCGRTAANFEGVAVRWPQSTKRGPDKN